MSAQLPLHSLRTICCLIALLCLSPGCRNRQYAHVLDDDDQNMVGSHTAGAETWDPLIEEAVVRLLGQSCATIQQASHATAVTGQMLQRSVCFAGVENRSSEPIGDFKEQIYDHIVTMVNRDEHFKMISRRYIEAAMAELRCSPESLVLPEKQRQLQRVLERDAQPVDYLLFAKITSGTTNSNGDYQRNYNLTLELLNIHTGESLLEEATIRKGYHKSALGSLRHY